ncbi:uncharacterized protein I206_103613 [Kwoniella pini CBS 10737]|uniref:Uncharacterized protein n=1 Tax=Kwoniella pini CBS 10737 TaxID=1296096 RepID=A0A1B9I983_9TREE|nr:uncharacterized protein I206_01384 [Kwoniella pini CBS 10737]OCF52099.1 hypothetical protein I206_01384 [Kwoniella pini CBS 10737]
MDSTATSKILDSTKPPYYQSYFPKKLVVKSDPPSSSTDVQTEPSFSSIAPNLIPDPQAIPRFSPSLKPFWPIATNNLSSPSFDPNHSPCYIPDSPPDLSPVWQPISPKVEETQHSPIWQPASPRTNYSYSGPSASPDNLLYQSSPSSTSVQPSVQSGSPLLSENPPRYTPTNLIRANQLPSYALKSSIPLNLKGRRAISQYRCGLIKARFNHKPYQRPVGTPSSMLSTPSSSSSSKSTNPFSTLNSAVPGAQSARIYAQAISHQLQQQRQERKEGIDFEKVNSDVQILLAAEYMLAGYHAVESSW